ncbi:MAG: hypothetical protein ABF636_10385 [Acetobacter sp.]
MAEDDTVRITLRIPADLHSRLSSSAHKYERSLNAEIVENLERAVPNDTPLAAFLRDEAYELTRQIESLKGILDEMQAQGMEYARRGADVLAGAILRVETNSVTRHLLDAEARLRRIKRVLGE